MKKDEEQDDYAAYKIGGQPITSMTRDELIGALKGAMDHLGLGPKR